MDIPLLKAKRSSALIDAQRMEAQLARLNQSAEESRIKTNILSVTRMFKEYVASLDEAINASGAELR
jgi:hypothetical protein